MCPHRYCQCWHLHIEAWKESMPRWLHQTWGRLPGSSACQPWGRQGGNEGCVYVFLWNVKDSIWDFCCVGKGSCTPLVSCQEEKQGCHAQNCCGGLCVAWWLAGRSDQSSKSCEDERAVADPAGSSQHRLSSHQDGDDHLHLRSQNAELSSKPPWGWVPVSGAKLVCLWAEHLRSWPRVG